ncbi:MAG TPA: lanthionine synthetase LanC family protein, partial [Longimicrobiaceae bacterium]
DETGTPGVVNPPVPPEPPAPQPPYPTSADRALGVAAGLVKAAEAVSGGARWGVTDAGVKGYPTDLYSGQAGVLSFLAEAYRFRPEESFRTALEAGGRWLQAQPRSSSQALFEGNAGRAWAFLSLHQALGGAGAPWLQAALELAPAVASIKSGLPGDLINGVPGQGLLLLRLHGVTGDARWLQAARELGDHVLATGVRVGEGVKFPSLVLSDGRTVFYPGMAHGSAGAAYFLCRLARALPADARGRYVDGARGAAAWLDGIARPRGEGVNWYRREPDQMDQQQVQWCHGAPGIGIFYAELYRTTGEAAHLEMAKRCAALVAAEGGQHWSACQCHGVGGNAEIFLKLHRETGDSAWLDKARVFGEDVWSRRFTHTQYPGWASGDGNNVDNPGLMTGTSGLGWLYLQLAQDGKLGGPVTD